MNAPRNMMHRPPQCYVRDYYGAFTNTLELDGMGCARNSMCERLQGNTLSYQRSPSHPFPSQRVCEAYYSVPQQGSRVLSVRLSVRTHISTRGPSSG